MATAGASAARPASESALTSSGHLFTRSQRPTSSSVCGAELAAGEVTDWEASCAEDAVA
jgi:hypothetical protein